MSLELNLRFPDKDHVVVHFDGEDSDTLPFTSPLTDKDRRDIQWYLEVYGAHSLGHPDDGEATRIAAQLPAWGKALFNAVFHDRTAERLFNQFQDSEDETRLLTISAEHPAILALPWELLHDPSPGGVFLFNETPRISIRRRVAGATGGRRAFKAKTKEGLHLLFVVSRPSGSGFLDPRADAQAVLEKLGATPSYEQATTLFRLGQCFQQGGRLDLAVQQVRNALAILEQFEQTDSVKRLRSACLTELANILRNQGQYVEARRVYKDGLKVVKELGDLRSQGVILGELGTLAMDEGNLTEVVVMR